MINRIRDLLLWVCFGALLTVAAQAQDPSAGGSGTPSQETQEHGSDLGGQGQQQHEHHEGHTANPSPAGRQQPKTQTPEPQEPEMEHMHHHMNIPPVTPELPHLGKAEQEMAGPAYRLEELEQIAVTHNPTLAQAAASINSAKGRRLQSGLYPNPSVGYEGSEIRGGAYGGGEQGFFVEQPFVTAGKLGLNRKIGDAQIVRAEAEAAAQRWRVLNSVRIAYYHVLAAQEMLAMKKSLQRISEDTLRITRQLHNVGQADDTEVLQAEIEEEAAETAVLTQQNTLARLWTALATVVGNPRLGMGTVQGNLEAEMPQPHDQQLLDSLLKESPQVRIAQADVAHAQATLVRAKREPIPDIDVRAGLQQNGELLNPPSRSVGLQGFATIGIQLHIFDRNQGNVAAARAEVEKAQKELQRVDLSLRQRFATSLQSYHNARIVVERYHTEILPRAQRAYELMVRRYGLMTASFPQVLNLQRTLYATETGYISALEALWINSIVLRGFLLTGGLEMPDQAGAIDLAPITEVNMLDRANPPSMIPYTP
jgi:outer membrane protein, heavy metal efflux system